MRWHGRHQLSSVRKWVLVCVCCCVRVWVAATCVCLVVHVWVCGESKREFQKVSTWSHEKRQKSSDEKDAKYFGSKKINDKCFGNGWSHIHDALFSLVLSLTRTHTHTLTNTHTHTHSLCFTSWKKCHIWNKARVVQEGKNDWERIPTRAPRFVMPGFFRIRFPPKKHVLFRVGVGLGFGFGLALGRAAREISTIVIKHVLNIILN